MVNGDPVVACPLTTAGRAQARALGVALADEPLDLVAVTEFGRVQETAELAVGARALPVLVVPELNEPRFGEFEGGPFAAYGDWAWRSGPLEQPPSSAERRGETRGEIGARYARGYRVLLERPEETILLVGHSLPLRYVLDAAAGRAPAQRAEAVEYTTVWRLSRAELDRAVAVLEAWAAAPVFEAH